MTPSDLKPQAEAVLLLQEEGVDVTRHRSRPVTEKLLNERSLILGMTHYHVQTAHRKCEEARGKTFLLKEYVGAQGRNTQIADPMGGTLEIFKKCFSELRAALQKLVEMPLIQRPHPNPPASPAPPPPETRRRPKPKRRNRRQSKPARQEACSESHDTAELITKRQSAKQSKPRQSEDQDQDEGKNWHKTCSKGQGRHLQGCT